MKVKHNSALFPFVAGLHMTLFIEQPEYVGLLTPESGVRVSVHDPKQRPFPEDDGLTVAPGFATSIGIKQVRTNDFNISSLHLFTTL